MTKLYISNFVRPPFEFFCHNTTAHCAQYKYNIINHRKLHTERCDDIGNKKKFTAESVLSSDGESCIDYLLLMEGTGPLSAMHKLQILTNSIKY